MIKSEGIKSGVEKVQINSNGKKWLCSKLKTE